MLGLTKDGKRESIGGECKRPLVKCIYSLLRNKTEGKLCVSSRHLHPYNIRASSQHFRQQRLHQTLGSISPE
jgi:hypothetical protein